MLDKLRKICDELLKNTGEEKYALIRRLLEDEKLFFNINIIEAYNILRDLGFSKEEIDDIYPRLIEKKDFM